MSKKKARLPMSVPRRLARKRRPQKTPQVCPDDMDQALTALAMPVSPDTDAALPGVFIKKVHVKELRARVK